MAAKEILVKQILLIISNVNKTRKIDLPYFTWGLNLNILHLHTKSFIFNIEFFLKFFRKFLWKDKSREGLIL